MTEGEAISGILKLMPIIILLVAAFWKLHPVLFQVAGGVAIITAMYIPDILNNGVTDELSISVALALILASYLCLAMAFAMMFRRARGMAENA